MTYLFTRAAAQGLQAFVPVAALILWLRITGRHSLLKAVVCGIAAAVPATIAAGMLFARAQQQAQWEAALATMSLALAVWFATLVFTDRPDAARRSVSAGSPAWLAVAAATTMVITRQTMEIFTVLAATGVDLRLDGPATMTIAGALIALATSIACVVLARRLDPQIARAAVRTFAIGFAAQVGFYGLHEAAEAHLLPASAALHAATEPYGPDSEFGQNMNYVLPPQRGGGVQQLRSRFSRGRRRVAPTAAAVSVRGVHRGRSPASSPATGQRGGHLSKRTATPWSLDTRI